MWVWDRILKTGNEGVWDEFASRGFLGPAYTMTERWHTDGESDAAFVDFVNPKAAFHWQERLRPLFESGLDFLKIDAGATLPYMEAAYDATARYGGETRGRGFTLSHANMAQPPPHLGGDASVYRFPTKWTGDASIRWTQESYPDLRGYRLGGLREQVRIFATIDDKGHYPFLATDCGGYSHGEPDDELFRRWSQFAAFTPVMCVFGAADQRASNNPFLFDEAAQESFRSHARLRMRLFPYLCSFAHLSRLTSRNIVRPVRVRDDEYLFGDAFLVAPVSAPGIDSRQVYFPEGTWHDYWSGERVHTGRGTTRRVAVRPDRLPLYVRAGAIVPMRAYPRAVELGSNDALEIHVWQAGDVAVSRFTLVEDDGSSNRYLEGGVAVSRIEARHNSDGLVLTVEPAEGGYAGMPETRTVTVVLHTEPRTDLVYSGAGGEWGGVALESLAASTRRVGPLDAVSVSTVYRVDRGLTVRLRERATGQRISDP